MSNIARPSEREIIKWFLDTATHAFHIESYLQRLQVGSEDPDRPHDIVNAGNKFEWEAVKGFALLYRKNGSKDYNREIMESREFHRQQYHHKMWGQFYPDAPQDAMKLGAVDAVCSLIEPRAYQKGPHSFNKIKEIADENSNHKAGWMHYAVAAMRRIKKPNLVEITAFSKIPKKLIKAETHDIILERVYEGLRILEQDHGYDFGNDFMTRDIV